MRRLGDRLRQPATLGDPAVARNYADKVKALAPIAYWPLSESSGTTAMDYSGNSRHGTHVGVTLAQPGIGDGRNSPLYDAVNDYTNVYSPGLDGAFNGAAGTMLVWGKVLNSGVWADAATRYGASISATANVVAIFKAGGANSVFLRYQAGGVTKTVSATVSSTGWVCYALTWNKAADQMIAYINGTQSGATQTGLGVWSGALSSTVCTIGAAITTPSNVWSGWLAHTALWSRALTAGEIASLARVS